MTWLATHWLWLTCTALLSIASALSFGLTRRVRAHLPVALVLAYGAASDVVRLPIGELVTQPERARLLALVGGDETKRAPFSGAVRAAFHVEEGLHMGWMFAVAWMAVVVCEPQTQKAPEARHRRTSGFIFAAWALVTFAVCRAYPALSGTVTARWDLHYVYAACHLGAALTCAVCFGRAWRRGDALVLRHLAVLVLGAAELLVVGSGPVAFGYWLRWDLARIVYGAAAAGLAWRTVRALQGHSGNGDSHAP